MHRPLLTLSLLTLPLAAHAFYPVVDTGQSSCYNNTSALASCPQSGQPFAGQDAAVNGLAPHYTDNGDGTITDNVTGLMWQKSPDFNGDGQINSIDKMGHDQARTSAANFRLAGYSDWRLPTIKELYSLINFDGQTGSADPSDATAPADAIPYLNTAYFDFAYGDSSAGERYIDAQFWSDTDYVSTTMNGNATAFGVNFADGRIKGYGTYEVINGTYHTLYVRYVRGGGGYGENQFVANGDGTVSDHASGLMWLQQDSGAWNAGSYAADGSLNWQEALAWCEALNYANHSDWRLPDAKELQSLVDYTRSPDTTDSAAIDPLFEATWLPNGVNNAGAPNYGHYWSSTTHLDGLPLGSRAVYLAFGEATGVMDLGSGLQLYDVHGAGAQRSDQKSGDPATLPVGAGPQGDTQSIYNLVRCVRDESNREGSFDSTTGLLSLPRVDAQGVGSFALSLSLIGDNPIAFRLQQATPVGSTVTAVGGFDPATGLAVLPRVRVGGTLYGATLRQRAGSMEFEVVNLQAR